MRPFSFRKAFIGHVLPILVIISVCLHIHSQQLLAKPFLAEEVKK